MIEQLRCSTAAYKCVLFVIAWGILSACGPDTTARPTGNTSVQPQPSPATAVAPTPLPRTGDANDLLLATTTSTQDSGLLDLLVPRFTEQTGYRVKVIAVGSGAAIQLGQRGEVDVVLAHAPAAERAFVEGGAGINRQLVMYNDFILVGPAADPAQLQGTTDSVAAMQAIAATGSAFVSRGDNSGTHQLEQTLWKAAKSVPAGQSWYIDSGTGMGQTLQIADQRAAYTLTDRATYLAWKARLALIPLVAGDPRLRNVYHVIAVNPDRYAAVNKDGAQAFIAFLLAPDTQGFISTFGKEQYGEVLFTPCASNSCQLANNGDGPAPAQP